MAIHEGETVAYTDVEGTVWEAKITVFWTQDCVNLLVANGDRPTSVPRYVEGMSGFYFQEV